MELRRGAASSSSAVVLLTLALLAGFLAACSSADRPASSTVTQPTIPGGVTVDPNGTVTVGVRSLPTNFNPSTPAGDNRITQMVMEQVWPQPFVTDPTFTIGRSELLSSAEVLSISPLVVQYVINPNAAWSDGVPITEADFAYDWHQHLTQSALVPNSGLVAGYRDIGSISASNSGRVVTVTFTRPFAQWQALFADLVPAHIAATYGWTGAFQGFDPSRVVSGGPFEVSSYSPGKSLVLSRNPHYWGPAAHVARIVFEKEPSDAAILAGLRSGELSVGEVGSGAIPAGVMSPGAAQVASAASSTTLPAATSTVVSSSQSRAHRLSWTGEAGNEIWQLVFNLQAPPLSDLSVRRGIEHALNRSEVVADSVDLVDTHVRPAVSRLLLAGEGSSPSSQTSAPSGQKTPPLYAPRASLRAFEDASYFPGAGGFLRYDKVGAPLRLTMLEPAGNPVVSSAGAVIQAELTALGVSVRIRRVPLAVLLEKRLPQSRFELALAPYAVSTTYAEMAPQYSDPVFGHGVSGGLSSAGAGSGTAGSSGAASTSSSPVGASGVVTPPGTQSPVANWATVVKSGTDPGAAVVGMVTRDVVGLDDPVVTSDFSAALAELNLPSALADIQLADQRLSADVVSIPLFQPAYALVRSVKLANVSESPTTAGIMWDAEDWVVVKRPATSGTS